MGKLKQKKESTVAVKTKKSVLSKRLAAKLRSKLLDVIIKEVS